MLRVGIRHRRHLDRRKSQDRNYGWISKSLINMGQSFSVKAFSATPSRGKMESILSRPYIDIYVSLVRMSPMLVSSLFQRCSIREKQERRISVQDSGRHGFLCANLSLSPPDPHFPSCQHLSHPSILKVWLSSRVGGRPAWLSALPTLRTVSPFTGTVKIGLPEATAATATVYSDTAVDDG